MLKPRRKWMRVVMYGIYIFIVVFFALEIILRIYNPFSLRLKGDKIVLPVNQKLLIDNSVNPKLDKQVVNTRNSLGFRGSEPPADWNNWVTIIAIGGSTTACHFLNDDKTWPWLTEKKLERSIDKVWVNNAGLDGHSTFGHEILLNDHVKKMHPDMILFLTGFNDQENDQPSFHDKMNTRGAYTDLKHYLFENSEVLNLLLNVVRGWRAQKLTNVNNSMLELKGQKSLVLTDAQIEARLKSQDKYLVSYRKRLSGLIDTCLANNIVPVMMTQPHQFGVGVDSLTGVDLETFYIDEGQNGKSEWLRLELYNDVVRELCKEKNVPLIDLARLVPKNSLYFYDYGHFTNEGAAVVAEVVSDSLVKIIGPKR
jgi:lysophospholipase L1-like esterase